MGKSKEVKETSQQRALADIGKAQMADFKQRWLPVQQKFAKGVVAAGADDSFERRRAATMAGVDTSANFARQGQKLDAGEAAAGAFGSSAHKLGITGMAEDQATSTGLNTVAAGQSVDDQYVAGLGAVNALGRGEKATAINGMETSAALSGRQAQADAERSMQNRMGNIQLASTLGGAALGQYGMPKPPVPGLGTNLFADATPDNIPPSYGTP